ncbi:MAG: phosphotransferase [Myxococcota bacterium]
MTAATIAGAGNMNRTVRVTTTQRSFILKQSQPYCVKFPEIPAPAERIEMEVAFYAIARRSERLRAHLPEVLEFAPENRLALIEDLGEGADLLSLYAGERLATEDLNLLCGLARELHALPLDSTERERLGNHAMRALNHEHIFDLPLRDENGLNLEAHTPGLTALAQGFKDDDDYVAAIIALGMLYTAADGPALLHGDYYPGSFLRTQQGLSIIDPEFTFPGPAEFDLGVLAAHLVFAAGSRATGDPPDTRDEDAVIERIAAGYAGRINLSLVRGFAGAELMRRLLGVSQLPLQADLEQKRRWLECSRRWVLDR